MPIPEHVHIRPTGLRAVSRDGRRLGRVVEVLRCRETRTAWAVVRRSRLLGRRRAVPLADASFEADRVRVAVTAERVRSAPRPARGGIDAAADDRLRRHYAL